MDAAAFQALNTNIMTRLSTKIRQGGKSWAQKFSKNATNFDSNDRQTFAHHLYVRPIHDMPKQLQEFVADAHKFAVHPYPKEPWYACDDQTSKKRKPHVQEILSAMDLLLRTMKQCAWSITPALLGVFHNDYSVATSYCRRNSSSNSAMLSLPTAYICKEREVAKEIKMDAETKADTKRMRGAIGRIVRLDNVVDLMRDMGAKDRTKIVTPGAKSKYKAIRDAWSSFGLENLREGTSSPEI